MIMMMMVMRYHNRYPDTVRFSCRIWPCHLFLYEMLSVETQSRTMELEKQRRRRKRQEKEQKKTYLHPANLCLQKNINRKWESRETYSKRPSKQNKIHTESEIEEGKNAHSDKHIKPGQYLVDSFTVFVNVRYVSVCVCVVRKAIVWHCCAL